MLEPNTEAPSGYASSSSANTASSVVLQMQRCRGKLDSSVSAFFAASG
eukprot:CAMPEP_0181251250 /NCGR_PEP_ID=MMETSP1096-20121128/46775_1 /TAXON_ID=156174 ORGANISM="Chrysochromulina ericina, Strain CCMP281" /NCGR_SAMPLE_ID=MMETSP1096 /ASSEMBLY_ACC=CAM_ASM_000453 /LENGTH=47 /DNA_ID= /DNA_START= /DNA_END= /DNA_ORIENTATION=